jgi:hypothetical protein
MNEMPAPGQQGGGTKAIERAIASNPAQKRQLKRNKSFASLFDDAEFQRLIK